MAVTFLVSIDLETVDSDNNGSLGFKTVCYLNRIYFSVCSKTLEKARQFLKNHFSQRKVYINATSLENVQDFISLLDSGAVKIVVTPEQRTKLKKDFGFDELDRLIVSLDGRKPMEFMFDPEVFDEMAKEKSRSLSSTFVDMSSDDFVFGEADVGFTLDPRHRIYVSPTINNVESYLKAAQRRAFVLVIPAKALTLDPVQRPELIPVALLITTSLQSDRPDGLYPTVVVNEQEVCLGLVYSSNESIAASLKTGKGVYKSRKRNGLWVKGETSGDYQDLVQIDWDCDGDTLRYVVRQHGDGTTGLPY